MRMSSADGGSATTAPRRRSRLLPPDRWPPTRPDSWKPYDPAELRDATRWLFRAGLLDSETHRLLVSIRLEMAHIARDAEESIVREVAERPGEQWPAGSQFYVARVLRQLPVSYFIRYQLFDVFRGIRAEGGVAASTRAALYALRDALVALRATPKL